MKPRATKSALYPCPHGPEAVAQVHSDRLSTSRLSPIFLLLLAACVPHGGSSPGPAAAQVSHEPDCGSHEACRPSLVGLLAEPERFDGKRIRVTGFLVPGDPSRLFLDEGAADNGLLDRSVLLQFDKSHPHTRSVFTGRRRYVALLGTFRSRRHFDNGVHGGLEEMGVLVPILRGSVPANENRGGVEE